MVTFNYHGRRCGHCQQFAPEYKKLAAAVKGFFHVGAVDASEHQSLGARFGVQGFPAIKIFGQNKNKPEDYNGMYMAYILNITVLSLLLSFLPFVIL